MRQSLSHAELLIELPTQVPRFLLLGLNCLHQWLQKCVMNLDKSLKGPESRACKASTDLLLLSYTVP